MFENGKNLDKIGALLGALVQVKGSDIPVIERSPGKSTPEVRTGNR